MKSFKELGIDVSHIEGQGKTTCPRCSIHRKKKDETCLSVNLQSGMFHCFNCGWSGGTKESAVVKEHYEKRTDYVVPAYDLDDTGLSEEVIEYFKGRGISEGTLKANYIGATTHVGSPVVLFPYIKDKVVNVKKS